MGQEVVQLTSYASSLCQMVVLCFAVVFGSFSQSYGPYPSATKMVLPRQHSSPESYTDSIGKWQPPQSCSSAFVFHPHPHSHPQAPLVFLLLSWPCIDIEEGYISKKDSLAKCADGSRLRKDEQSLSPLACLVLLYKAFMFLLEELRLVVCKR